MATFDLKDIELYRAFQKSPLLFIEKCFGLIPQPLKPEYEQIAAYSNPDEYKAEWFETFEKGKHITWQQALLFKAFENGIKFKGQRKIAIESGVGCGKSSALAMLIIWFLFCHKDAQVPCTAPTAAQMYNALWKEVAVWLDRMPKELQEMFEWSSEYVRIRERPNTWYARARTASKDKPEALAGVHSDHVLAVADEASGIIDEVFEKGEGVLAGENVFVVMISQHTRLVGYFHDAFNSDAANWQKLRFNSEESPIVDKQLMERIADKHGKDSDRYRVEILGQSPKADAVDEKGYVPLLQSKDIREADDDGFSGPKRLGVDPAGDGQDEAVWTIRDRFKAKIVAIEKTSTGKGIAQKTIALAELHRISQDDIYVDAFGVGVDSCMELAMAGWHVNAVNVGEKPSLEGEETFINKRAEATWGVRDWLLGGGSLVDPEKWEKEMLAIRYRRELNNKIKIMSKDEMRKAGIPSPNRFDALMLTFVNPAPMAYNFAQTFSVSSYSSGDPMSKYDPV